MKEIKNSRFLCPLVTTMPIAALKNYSELANDHNIPPPMSSKLSDSLFFLNDLKLLKL
jgi:hypothetical protein